MAATPREHSGEWFRARAKRHGGELFRLAWPVMLSRLGIVTLGLADTIMVGAFSTLELAYLNLGSATMVMVYLVVAVGLLMGTLIETADAFGAEDWARCGRVFRRALPYTVAIGLAAMALGLPGEALFLLTGQTPELAAGGGRVMTILALGLVGHVVFVHATFFLEGIGRPKPVLLIMVIGNLLNVALNYVLIFGHFGFPAMGAEGSAWATTTLRLAMMALALGYLAGAPSLARYKVFAPAGDSWKEWKSQRMKGYAAAFSLGVEVIAFAALALFAGWLGTLALAAWGVVFNVMTIPFMLAAGLGAATAIRVGMCNARRDPQDTALAGWTGFVIGSLVLVACAVPLYFLARPVFALYSGDAALIAYGAPFVAFAAFVIYADGAQAILANALRGLGETWVPTGIQTIVYIVIMIPASYALAFPLGRGLSGLLEAVLYASIVSIVLQGWRFRWKTRAAYPLFGKVVP